MNFSYFSSIFHLFFNTYKIIKFPKFLKICLIFPFPSFPDLNSFTNLLENPSNDDTKIH